MLKKFISDCPDVPPNLFHQYLPVFPNKPVSFYAYSLISDAYSTFLSDEFSLLQMGFKEEKPNEHSRRRSTSTNYNTDLSKNIDSSMSTTVDSLTPVESPSEATLSRFSLKSSSSSKDPFLFATLNPLSYYQHESKYSSFHFTDYTESYPVEESESAPQEEKEKSYSTLCLESDSDEETSLNESSLHFPRGLHHYDEVSSFPTTPVDYSTTDCYNKSFIPSSYGKNKEENKVYDSMHFQTLKHMLLSDSTNEFVYMIPMNVLMNLLLLLNRKRRLILSRFTIHYKYFLHFIIYLIVLCIETGTWYCWIRLYFGAFQQYQNNDFWWFTYICYWFWFWWWIDSEFYSSVDNQYLCKCILEREMKTFSNQALSYFRYSMRMNND